MGRTHSNARTLEPAFELTSDVTALVAADVTTPLRRAGHPTGRAQRAAAKAAPSRIEARLYTAIREIGDQLDAITRTMNRTRLLDEHAAALGAAVRRTRVDLTAVRGRVENATHDQLTHDSLKDELARLRSYTAALDASLVSLASVARVVSSGADVTGFVRTDADTLCQRLAGGDYIEVNQQIASVRRELSLANAA